jgi:hypothetical protein
MAYLQRCIANLRDISELTWIVIEDAAERSQHVAALLAASQLSYVHLQHGPTRCFGNAQRDHGLRYIRQQRLTGVVYLMDDDNHVQRPLFNELRKVSRVGILPVGLLGPWGIERPILSKGRIVGWHAHWLERQFCVDMAGFAFDASLLDGMEAPLWAYPARGGESEFLERLVQTPAALEILADDCRRCWVWHDLPLGQPVWRALLAYRWHRLLLLLVALKRRWLT